MGDLRGVQIAVTMFALLCTAQRLPAQEAAADQSALLAAVRDFVASTATGRLGFDPRPLRPGFNTLTGGDPGDFVTDAEIVRSRAEAARAIGLPIADLGADQRCTFTEPGAPLPGRVYPPEVIQNVQKCRERGPFTTFVSQVAVLAPDSAGNRRVARTKVVVFLASGYFVWDLTLREEGQRAWCVQDAKRVFSIMS